MVDYGYSRNDTEAGACWGPGLEAEINEAIRMKIIDEICDGVAVDNGVADPDSTDFITVDMRDTLSAADKTNLDAFVAAHKGEIVASPSIDPRTGIEVFEVSPYAYSAESYQRTGYLVDAIPAQTLYFHDVEVTAELWVKGGSIWSDAWVRGDYVEFSVVDKNDVLGLFATYGLTVGVDVLEIGKLLRTIYLRTGATEKTLTPPTAQQVSAGLFLRVSVYNSHLLTPLDCEIEIEAYED